MLKILKRKDERQDESREKGNVAVLEETPLGREMLEPVVEKEEDTAENADETEQVETEGEAQEDRSCGITVEFQMAAESFAKGGGVDPERLEEALAFMQRTGEAWRDGALTVDLLETVIKGLGFDAAVANAFAEGELQGRNTRIAEEFMKPEDSDGLPHLSGRGNIGSGRKKVSSIFDLARSAG